ncbi:site-specific integrase [Dysgonomonas sp. Marseille-P4677]|uniref:tyrosine-type recombinase/integrase n=1 Tax=Dysgonomonas sp. Marseille-P4677 TaxID=2364790 RepID=UPI0019113A0F|nr:site-specific integrase [Dysgonomonas sp. Marseille-P4677]MBK5720159.1 site-specific integrase [Dysgonomonas sp. Marseille-P4677]
MDTIQKNGNPAIEEIKGFSYPKLYTGKMWYVGFRAYDPAMKKLRQKRIKLNHIDKIGDRRKYADGLMKRLVVKLEKGWNPWIEVENEKAYKTFTEACEHYRKYIKKLLDDGVLREDTHRSYKSQLQNIENWNKSKTIPIEYIYQFNREFISDFLDYIYEELQRSVVTRNNYLLFASNFSQFLVDKQYLKSKPSEGINPISTKRLQKKRTIIDEHDIIRLCDYLSKENRYYLLACYILHYCFVRRKEMSLLKLSYFNIQNQTLFIPGEIAKNGDSATVTLPEKIIHLMLELRIFDNPGHYYLFSKDFRPGTERKHEKQFTDYWAYHVRKNLKFPDRYQFYSLKDTGITDMLQRYDVLTVRDQARHSDIKMTDKYTPKDRIKANPLIIKHDGML